MVNVPYRVYIVVDREFGEKLAELEPGVPVWIVDTPTNKPVVQRLRKEHSYNSHLNGITTFDDLKSCAPEDILLAELDVIDLHHGSCSADPPYTVLEVVGTQLSDRAKREMFEYAFNDFQTTSTGFVARRPEPSKE
jgi:hypothetical protein